MILQRTIRRNYFLYATNVTSIKVLANSIKEAFDSEPILSKIIEGYDRY